MRFRDLKTQYHALKDDIDRALLDVAESGTFINGKPVNDIEKALSKYVGVKHCITCANGTDALTLALMTWGIGQGDAVFIPDFTFFASAEVVSFQGATPVFVDVYADTFNIDTSKLENSIIEVIASGELLPKAIISVDLFGQPANYIEINRIAKKYGLYVLEDAAQGFGGSINGKKSCSFGDISTTSFFPAKPLGCYGDGGAVFTENDEWAEKIKSLCVHGKGTSKYDNIRIGINSRLDSIQAAVLLCKLDAFIEYELKAVNDVAASYTEKLQGVVKTPFISNQYTSSWAQYTIILENMDQRNELYKYLKDKDIPTMIYYAKPMHSQTAFGKLEFDTEEYKVSKMLSECVLSLPMHPYLSDNEIETVCELINSFFTISIK